MIKKLLAMAALAIPMLATPLVTYTTAGFFTGGMTSGTDNLTLTGGTLHYLTGGGSVDVGATGSNPSNVSLGSVDAAGFPSLTSLVGSTLTITITQTGPFAGSGTTVGSLGGSIKSNAGVPTILFSPSTITMPGPGGASTVYTVVQPATGIHLTLPTADSGSGLGRTTIQGEVFFTPGTTTTPEPATLGLMGVGLIGLGLVARRRRA